MIDAPKLELTAHPCALKFPPLSPEARELLKADIKANGLMHPIVVNQSGQILDGWHRYQITGELGIEPKTVQLSDLSADKVSEIEFIFASNFHRRQLSDDQRVAVATAFLPN